jgi:HEAT repeat protein
MSLPYPTAPQATRDALRLSLQNRAEQFQKWLMAGQIKRVIDTVEKEPAALADLIALIADMEVNVNARIGASAVLERFTGTASLQALIPLLGKLSAHADARVRAEACHFLGLSVSSAASQYLVASATDSDAEVREIAAESLASLPAKNPTERHSENLPVNT